MRAGVVITDQGEDLATGGGSGLLGASLQGDPNHNTLDQTVLSTEGWHQEAHSGGVRAILFVPFRFQSHESPVEH